MICYTILSKSIFKEHRQPLERSFHSLYSVAIKFCIQFLVDHVKKKFFYDEQTRHLSIKIVTQNFKKVTQCSISIPPENVQEHLVF